MTTTRLLRHVNALRCLRLLQGGQSLSRADMARALGVTRATIGHAVAELTASGLVLEAAEAEPAPARIGRPGVALRLNPEGAHFIGVEIDTRAITAVRLNLDMVVTQRRVEPTGAAFADPQAMTARIVAVARSLAAETDRITGLGVAVPGLVGRLGEVVNAPLLGWRDFPLQQALTEALPSGWTIEVGNDAFAFASAERATQAAPSSLLMVLLAEGVGSAHLAEGNLIAGAHGFAGELGHMVVAVRDGPGQIRAAKFEDMAGAAGFPAAMRPGRPVAEGVAALLATAETPETRASLALWARALATGLANAAHLLDPDRIVLGGPLSALYPLVADQIDAHLKSLMLQGHARPSLHLARFGAEGAAIGAAARLREALFALPDLQQPSPAALRAAVLSSLPPDPAPCQTGPIQIPANPDKGPQHDQQT